MTEQEQAKYNTEWSERELLEVYLAWKHLGKPGVTTGAQVDWVIDVAKKIGRTPSAVSLRVANFASWDTKMRQKGLGPAGERMRQFMTTIKTLEALKDLGYLLTPLAKREKWSKGSCGNCSDPSCGGCSDPMGD